MNSKSSLVEAVSDSHTVFLVTNYWESAKYEVEVSQGKNVADAAKEAGVQHLIFSSLLHVTRTTDSRLKNVPHFDGKADIEDYIRASGVPCTFVLAGYFMSNYAQMLQKGEDGSYTLAYPVGKDAKFPLIDIAEDIGKELTPSANKVSLFRIANFDLIGNFVAAIIKNRDSVLGARILAAADYYTPERILAELEEVTGKKTKFVQVTAEQYKGFLPEFMAEEMLENHLFIEKPGYYNGESLNESHKILEKKPTTWKEYIVKSGAF